ncbi:Pq loop repeat protein [Neofusicoccum parvum]|uniref:Pq loop repeat protein n=1 Tax=Neofusicoccum parvum TaxID=310453 RepID=A0ACB5SBJ0_9PEZI|nr:Pq loop repeat protein [Neofusicoccum parvum]GME60635.1 Pq loop repeat protein [Neofusicoccum parvum]
MPLADYIPESWTAESGIMGFFSAIVTHIAPAFIVTSPITSYADQIYSIHRTRSSAGFSLDIPLIMLVASILKVFFWFGDHFALSLLFQAILMIFVQVLLLHVALMHRPPPTSQHTPFAAGHATPRPYNFWQWRPRRPYWNFLLYFTGTLVVLHVLLSSTALFTSYTAVLGYIALAIEACLPLPQILANQRAKSTKGFRPSVLLNWLIGDSFKLTFFFLSPEGEVPAAFKLCGIFQACCDAYLGVQWWTFGNGIKDHEKVNGIPL